MTIIDNRFYRRPGITAAIYAGAIGDAWGYHIEFMNRDAITHRFGGVPQDPYGERPGALLVSDDTQMTMFTLEGAIRGMKSEGSYIERITREIWKAYLDWHDTQTNKNSPHYGTLADQVEMQVSRAPGNTCLDALVKRHPGTPFKPVNQSKGCGGVMRVAPLGLLKFPLTSLRAGIYAAALTHGHPDGWGPAGILADILNRIKSGEDISSATLNAIEDMKAWVEINKELLHSVSPGYDLYYRAIEMGKLRTPPEQAYQTLGAGWVGDEALAIAIYSALARDNLSDVIKLAIYHDGDSDSTGSIAAQIYAARNGLDVPQAWIDDLDVKNQLDDLIASAEAGILGTVQG